MGKIRKEECHICHKYDGRIKIVCSIERCSLAFCISCIRDHFDEDFQLESYKPQYWICYSCGKRCKCNPCRGILPETKIKKIRKQIKHSKPVKIETAIMDECKVQHGKLQETNTQIIVAKKPYNSSQQFRKRLHQQKIISKDIIQNKHQYRRKMLLQIRS